MEKCVDIDRNELEKGDNVEVIVNEKYFKCGAKGA